MAQTIIYGASILTLDAEDSFYYPGTVEIEGDRIARIYHGNPSDEVLSDPSITAIDGTDKLVMPGFVDLHFHTSVAKLPLQEYLEEVWYPSVRALTPERAYIGALHSYCTAIKSSTTTVNDMYRFVGSLAEAAAKIGIRAVLSIEVALPEHKLDLLEDNKQLYLQHNGKESDQIRVWLGHEWICTSNLELMAEVGKMKKKLVTGLHIHLCESQQEVEDTRAKYGRAPVEIAYESGCLGLDTVAAHCVHLTDKDIGLLAKTAPQSPTTRAPTQSLETALSGCRLFKKKDASLAKPYNILRMATKNGAKELGIDAGVIAPRKTADLIVVFTPLLKNPPKRKMMLESHLVFGCNGSAVQHSIIDGMLVMKDFKVLALDKEKLRQDMDALFEEISEGMKSLIVK
ncbi:unnamed protein product [Clonostachys chloroleuca]|uniref:Amidohydrolase-related domain-containing protein n=1 Tax=Clonostachys chloroleuca TaxID=1926264 RepID=A0AA35VL96_9HYPO|nr:unnamed protein product [Clonostachys chloroleuca]